MELNLVPLIEAAKGITWQGAVVVLASLAAACYLARLRGINNREEREWWARVPPEVSQARAATTATLPKPGKAPPSPVGPLLMLAVFLSCAFVKPDSGPAPSILQAHKAKSEGWLSSAQAGELARVGTGDPGTTPAPGRTPPGPVKKDCDPRTCRPPSQCRNGECQGSARKPPPTRIAGQASSPSSYAVRAAWQDSEPEAFPERLSDELWLSRL